ncbi:TonB-dependent siderophore receptor [Shinella sp. BYT-45]|uniref:TonB-dependent siderophore receptor n=1 Tax=Shinella sp. BYT-45 TaxID=3377377 RepID=UPI00397F815F
MEEPVPAARAIRRRRLWLASGAALAFAAAAGPAHAQDAGATTLETITVEGGQDTGRGPDKGIVAKRSRSASKTNTSIRETPQAVSVVTRDEMDARGANSVREALRYTPGVMAEANGDDVRGGWMWLRGYNAYARLWLDGLALAGDPDGYASTAINSYALERVEVIKGPASVLYGQTVPGGLVNQVGKRPQTTTRNEVEVTTSSLGGIQVSVDFTGPVGADGDWSYRLVGQGRDLGSQIDKERNRQSMLFPSLTWSPDEDTSFTVYGFHQKVNPENFSGRFYPAFGTLISNPAGQIPVSTHMGDYLSNANEFDANLYMAGYELSHNLNESLTFRQNLRYSYADQNMFLAIVNPAFAWTTNPPSGTRLGRAVSASDDVLSSIDIDNQLEARFDTGALDHTMLFGFEYIHVRSDRYFGSANITSQDYLNPVYGGTYPFPAWNTSRLSKQNQLGAYVQDQVRYGNWLATLGLRYDRSEITTIDRLKNVTYENTDGALSGRAGLAYLFDNGLTPYASFSTSFLPTIGADVYGDPYKAQESQQFEVGVKYAPEGAPGMIGVSLYDLTLDNALTPVYSGTGATLGNIQTGEQRIRGLEIEGKYELTPEVDLVASYAYSDSEVLKTNIGRQLGQDMLRVPRHQGAVWMQYRPEWAEGLALSAGVRATSSYHTDTTYLDSLEIPGLALVDIGAQYDLGALNKDFAGTTLRVNVSNLFNKTYVVQCTNATGGSCNYGPARTITASLKFEW